MLSRRFLILPLSVLLTLANCAGEKAPVRPEEGTRAEAVNPLPLPGTTAPATPAKDRTPTPDTVNPFSVLIRNCYLSDPEINPLGESETKEKGIRMVVTGSIRNNSDRILYRAGVYTKLVVYFGKNARFEKHSGGLGFDPPVTSTNPWRAGAWRDFEIVGRAFDPIYREYEPRAISGVLSLEAKDPLGYSFSQEIAKMKPRWETLFGAVTDQIVPVEQGAKLAYGPNSYKTDLKSGDKVKLIAQQGGAYLVSKDNRLAGWIAQKNLGIRQYESMYPENPARTFPMVATSEGRYEITVSDYKYLQTVKALPEVEGGYFAFHVRVKTLAQKQQLPLNPSFFWLDQGSGRAAPALDKVAGVEDALAPAPRMPIGSEFSGWIFIPRLANGWPFALVFQWSKTADPTHVFLLPAINREGAKKAPATEEPKDNP